mmetsp:Transcript_1671/g.2415  ORF Transcript_1671/g.2415 Transcript_1671/m.2415 type:complete len:91 (-) Transcript_1671:875-1147(-)
MPRCTSNSFYSNHRRGTYSEGHINDFKKDKSVIFLGRSILGSQVEFHPILTSKLIAFSITSSFSMFPCPYIPNYSLKEEGNDGARGEKNH